MRMPFGKYVNKEINELPTSYLEWLSTVSYGRVFNEVCNVLSLSDCGPEDDINAPRTTTVRKPREETYEQDTREVSYDDFGPVGFKDGDPDDLLKDLAIHENYDHEHRNDRRR